MPGPFNRILVPVDFSEATDDMINAGRATPIGEGVHVEVAEQSVQALQLARGLVAEGGEIRLIHATPPLERSGIYGGPAGLGGLAAAIDEIHRSAKQAALKCLQFLGQEHLGDIPGIKLSFEARNAVPVDFVVEEAQEMEAELVIVAASGRSGVARFFLGSTADRVIRQSPCPVLVVPTTGN